MLDLGCRPGSWLQYALKVVGPHGAVVGIDRDPLPQPIRLNTVPVYPGGTTDIVIQGTNPGHWHFHDHSDKATTNNGHFPGGMMTMLAYEDAEAAGFKFHPVVAVDS